MIIYYKIDFICRIKRAQTNCQYNFVFVFLAPQKNPQRQSPVMYTALSTPNEGHEVICWIYADRLANSMIPRWQDRTNRRQRGSQPLCLL